MFVLAAGGALLKSPLGMFFMLGLLMYRIVYGGMPPALTHKKKAAIKVVFVVVIPPVVIYAPKKRVTVTIERRRILPYSAMKRSANSPPPYSMLNPETNSLSPSARSNGARFVSANLLVNHIKKRGGERNANQIV